MSEPKRKYHDALDDVLDRPIAFNPAFKRITASTVAGIFLSQAWYWSKRHNDDDGWFWKTQKEWEEETALSRSEQETARKHCIRVGVIEEKLKGIPATMYYRVNKAKVYELLGFQFAEPPQTENAGIQQTSDAANSQFAGLQQSDGYSNINKETETPSEIPSNNTNGYQKFSQKVTDERKEMMKLGERIEALIGVTPDFTNRKWEKTVREIVKKEAAGQKFEQFVKWLKSGNDYNRPKPFQIATNPGLILNNWAQAFMSAVDSTNITRNDDGSLYV